jgi:undecaprenyl-diphosphatase
MTYGQGVLLGLVQGATEFLPISSSGHLVLVPLVLGWPDQGLALDAVLHLGTLGALVAYFRRELIAMLVALAGGEDDRPARRLALLLAAATLPAALAGLLFDRLIEQHLRVGAAVATSTIVWGLAMLAADRWSARRPPVTKGEHDLSWAQGLLVGVAQAIALIPGTSRSGIAITAGLFGGLDRPTAARFAFLLGIPITAAAGTAKMLDLLREGIPGSEWGHLALAVVAAFGSGWAAVWFLVHYLKRHSLVPFVAYRVALGLVILALAAFRP